MNISDFLKIYKILINWFQTVGRISNICFSLQKLGYNYSLSELMQLLSLDADELQDVYNRIREGKYGKVESYIRR